MFLQQGATTFRTEGKSRQKCVRGFFAWALWPKQLPKRRQPSKFPAPFFWCHFLFFIPKETPLFLGGDRIFGGFQAEYAVPDDHLHPLRACHLFTHRLRLRLVAAPRCFYVTVRGHVKFSYQDLSSSLIFFLY